MPASSLLRNAQRVILILPKGGEAMPCRHMWLAAVCVLIALPSTQVEADKVEALFLDCVEAASTSISWRAKKKELVAETLKPEPMKLGFMLRDKKARIFAKMGSVTLRVASILPSRVHMTEATVGGTLVQWVLYLPHKKRPPILVSMKTYEASRDQGPSTWTTTYKCKSGYRRH